MNGENMRLAQTMHRCSRGVLLVLGALTPSVAILDSAHAESAFGYGDTRIEPLADESGVPKPLLRNETFRGLDKDRNGSLSRAEMINSPRYAAWRKMDRNRDGKISAREYSDYRVHRERGASNITANSSEPDYGDPYLNSRLRKRAASETEYGVAGPEDESYYERMLRKANLERERRKYQLGN